MHYISVTELLSPAENPVCKIQGLPSTDLNTLESCFLDLHLTCKNLENFIEVDFSGVDVLNILCGLDFRVVSQCMAIEVTAIGGRTMKIQKIFWTMAKE
ncbi:uncharacterized protein LOC123868250 isoform X2 [Maniola jurtina]|uniref:uncharacterized protein LOC123868250 isoform X2 n=1 Tax=Maniola jurtina TaxID=191418 RepID=UPI001E685DAC|nr:uncharacterized protein LOC123868250 isoform X2 [Maniola jurtina]